jgi:hypothetical protein
MDVAKELTDERHRLRREGERDLSTKNSTGIYDLMKMFGLFCLSSPILI